METKFCRSCEQTKSLDAFYVIKSGKRRGLYHTYCRSCLAAQVQRWTVRNRAKVQVYQRQFWKDNPHLKIRAEMKRYGKDEVWYAAQLAAQGGVCAICKGHERRKGFRLSVDHHHGNGRIRGLLCNACNNRLTPLEDHGWVAAAVAYLKHYEVDGPLSHDVARDIQAAGCPTSRL